MRSFRLEHSPLSLLNSVWGMPSAGCSSAAVLKAGWGTAFYIGWTSPVCKIWCYRVFHWASPMSTVSETSRFCLPFGWNILRPQLCAYRNFSTPVFRDVCSKWAVQNAPKSRGPSACGCGAWDLQGCCVQKHRAVQTSLRGVDGQINVNLCGSLVVQGSEQSNPFSSLR